MRGTVVHSIASLGAICVFTVAAGAEQYLCTVKRATGFEYKNGEWSSPKFDPGITYLITPPPDHSPWQAMNYQFIVKRVRGKSVGKFPSYTCKAFDTNILRCDGVALATGYS